MAVMPALASRDGVVRAALPRRRFDDRLKLELGFARPPALVRAARLIVHEVGGGAVTRVNPVGLAPFGALLVLARAHVALKNSRIMILLRRLRRAA